MSSAVMPLPELAAAWTSPVHRAAGRCGSGRRRTNSMSLMSHRRSLLIHLARNLTRTLMIQRSTSCCSATPAVARLLGPSFPAQADSPVPLARSAAWQAKATPSLQPTPSPPASTYNCLDPHDHDLPKPHAAGPTRLKSGTVSASSRCRAGLNSARIDPVQAAHIPLSRRAHLPSPRTLCWFPGPHRSAKDCRSVRGDTLIASPSQRRTSLAASGGPIHKSNGVPCR